MGKLQESMSTATDKLPKLQMASHLPDILKAVEAQYGRLKRAGRSGRGEAALSSRRELLTHGVSSEPPSAPRPDGGSAPSLSKSLASVNGCMPHSGRCPES